MIDKDCLTWWSIQFSLQYIVFGLSTNFLQTVHINFNGSFDDAVNLFLLWTATGTTVIPVTVGVDDVLTAANTLVFEDSGADLSDDAAIGVDTAEFDATESFVDLSDTTDLFNKLIKNKICKCAFSFGNYVCIKCKIITI